ncbi:MAG: peptidylprolyl isomerase [Ruminococcus sp.]|nr:peptidylprolyl isomerase [Ruminococcus sp.]
MLKRVLAVLVCTFTLATVFSSCGKEAEIVENSNKETVDESLKASVKAMNFTAPQNGDTIIIMNIKDYGEVRMRLFPEYADKGVENFIGLAEKGYYDGLTFHRVIKDFMIQGGDPNGNGTGGESIWGGKFDGGTDPHLIHTAGALAYANSGATSTDGSQFYIVTGQVCSESAIQNYIDMGYDISEDAKNIYMTAGGAPWLDGSYTVFGQVYQGLDIIFQIQNVSTDTGNDKPMKDVIIESVKVEKYNGEELKWYISDYDGYEAPSEEETLPAEEVKIENYSVLKEGDKIAVMDIEGYGEVKLRFFPEYAEKGVENFIGLAEKGYYDGLTFHRVIKDFMIQGGDPDGNGTGGESMWGGDFDGGTDPHLIHTSGAVAYANSGSTATDGSQFYIVTGEVYSEEDLEQLKNYGQIISDEAMKLYSTIGGTPWLDGAYTIFGQVYDGLDIVFEIQNTETDRNDKPLDDVVINSIKIGEYDGSAIHWFISDYDGSAKTNETQDTQETDETQQTEEEVSETVADDTSDESSEESPV